MRSEFGGSSGRHGDGKAAQPPPAAAPDAGVRNPVSTAPHTCNILRHGVDSLYLSFQGALTEDAWKLLSQAKKHAQSEEDKMQALAVVFPLDQQFSVSPGGARYFPFILTDDRFRIQLKSRNKSRIPLAYCQIKSAYLTEVGPQTAAADLRALIATFGDIDGPPAVSRIDLFADFTAALGLAFIERRAWVTRGRDAEQFWDGDICTGWAIGQRGVVSATLYDKTQEIKKSGKDYLKQLWHRTGWNPPETVLRMEFRFLGEFLRQVGPTDLPHVLGQLPSLWAYATTDWLRLALPNPEDGTKSRWPTDPIWEALAGMVWEGGAPTPLNRVLVPGAAPKEDRLFGYYLAALTSWMALKGVEEPLEGAVEFFSAARKHFDDLLFISGRSFDDLARDRAARKATQWHLSYPGVKETVQGAELEEAVRKYRKASGR